MNIKAITVDKVIVQLNILVLGISLFIVIDLFISPTLITVNLKQIHHGKMWGTRQEDKKMDKQTIYLLTDQGYIKILNDKYLYAKKHPFNLNIHSEFQLAKTRIFRISRYIKETRGDSRIETANQYFGILIFGPFLTFFLAVIAFLSKDQSTQIEVGVISILLFVITLVLMYKDQTGI